MCFALSGILSPHISLTFSGVALKSRYQFASSFGVGLEWLPHCTTWVYETDHTLDAARERSVAASKALKQLFEEYDGWSAAAPSLLHKVKAVVGAAISRRTKPEYVAEGVGPACGKGAADPRIQGARARACVCVCVCVCLCVCV